MFSNQRQTINVEKDDLFLIDFGMAKKFKDKSGNHKP